MAMKTYDEIDYRIMNRVGLTPEKVEEILSDPDEQAFIQGCRERGDRDPEIAIFLLSW